MARKTREESLNTKNRILDAAELVLLEKGVGQTAMADIAEAAGMSRGAVYGHFNGKIEVCVAVCDRAFSRAVEGFDLSDERPALATLRLAASHYLHQCGEPGSMQRVLEILYMKCEQSEENAPLMRRRARDGGLHGGHVVLAGRERRRLEPGGHARHVPVARLHVAAR
ncbi:TetR family regulatory protein [Burkholderia pseudomallei]|nr:TetR family regulatory protein [Burkholderia pseudomallei]